MCGRYTVHDKASDIEFMIQYFTLRHSAVREIPPRYNAAPGQNLPVVFQNHTTGDRILNIFRWGLIPHWADDEQFGYRTVNARAETLSVKPAFKSAFKSQRCLVPASGFFEWEKKNDRLPHFYRLKKEPVLSLAGLYDHWTSPEGKEIWSYTIITTDANKMVHEVHPRMPAIIHQSEFGVWLDPGNSNTNELSDLLRPYPESEFESWAVSKDLNRPVNDYPELLRKIA